MKSFPCFVSVLFFSLLLPLTLQATPALFGEYVEARTCDVWTGPCFSNSEENTAGELAVLGWAVQRGTWDGQDLSGLKIALAIRAQGTLCTDGEGKAKAIVFVDARASEDQARALLSMAKKLAGKYLENVVEVRKAEILYERQGVTATLEVPETLKVHTMGLNKHCDTICGNEKVAYPPLAETAESSCAKAVEHFYKGVGLGARWSDPHKRSAMVGTFSL